MAPFVKFLESNAGVALVALAALCLVLATLVAVQFVRSRRLERRWKTLLSGADGNSLESMLHSHFAEREDAIERLRDAQERIEVLERKMRTAKRYAGLVNYDAFEDVGGSQSCSLALYDEEGNGVVLTSQVGREGCRVYGKGLVHGRSERHLSREEQAAIEQATEARPRPRISP